MDTELIFWIAFFVGGYCFVLAFLLRVAFRPGDERDESDRSEGSRTSP